MYVLNLSFLFLIGSGQSIIGPGDKSNSSSSNQGGAIIDNIMRQQGVA